MNIMLFDLSMCRTLSRGVLLAITHSSKTLLSTCTATPISPADGHHFLFKIVHVYLEPEIVCFCLISSCLGVLNKSEKSCCRLQNSTYGMVHRALVSVGDTDAGVQALSQLPCNHTLHLTMHIQYDMHVPYCLHAAHCGLHELSTQ